MNEQQLNSIIKALESAASDLETLPNDLEESLRSEGVYSYNLSEELYRASEILRKLRSDDTDLS